MNWIKKGLIFRPKENFLWSKTHAQMPLFYKTTEGNWRLYYSTRNNNGQSNFSFIETKSHNPKNITYFHDKPLLDFGNNNSFDHSGIMASSLVKNNNELFLYYIGWSLPMHSPYHVAIGLAISKNDGLTFEKFSHFPIFDKQNDDLLFCSAPYVIKEQDMWKMWYISCIKWVKINDKDEPIYSIKYSESEDGINWSSNKNFAIKQNYEFESITNPCVIYEDKKYKMWYSTRGSKNYRSDKSSSYRIGYAESIDAEEWVRKDERAGITISENGWDSEMICYANIAIIDEKKYIFYNGNGFGKSGFGYAIAE